MFPGMIGPLIDQLRQDSSEVSIQPPFRVPIIRETGELSATIVIANTSLSIKGEGSSFIVWIAAC